MSNGLLLSSGHLSRLAKIWKVSEMTELAKRPCITLYECIPGICYFMTTIIFFPQSNFVGLYQQTHFTRKPNKSQPKMQRHNEVGHRTSLKESWNQVHPHLYFHF